MHIFITRAFAESFWKKYATLENCADYATPSSQLKLTGASPPTLWSRRRALVQRGKQSFCEGMFGKARLDGIETWVWEEVLCYSREKAMNLGKSERFENLRWVVSRLMMGKLRMSNARMSDKVRVGSRIRRGRYCKFLLHSDPTSVNLTLKSRSSTP